MANLLSMRFGDFLNVLRAKGRYLEAESYRIVAQMECMMRNMSHPLDLSVEEVIKLIGEKTPRSIPGGWDHFYWGKSA